jgi:hypothetical protein
VGRVWQITACDAASSYATARVFAQTQPTAETAARFPRRVLVPLYREAGWPIQGVLTDGGGEFSGLFAPPAASWASGTRAPGRATPGRTASSSACRERSSMSTGGGVPPALLQPLGPAPTLARRLPAFLHSRAAAPGLPAPAPHAQPPRLGSSAMKNPLQYLSTAFRSSTTQGRKAGRRLTATNRPDLPQPREPILSHSPSLMTFTIGFTSAVRTSLVSGGRQPPEGTGEAPSSGEVETPRPPPCEHQGKTQPFLRRPQACILAE